MGNILRRIRERSFAAALTITAVLAFGTLGGVAPASAEDAVDTALSAGAPASAPVSNSGDPAPVVEVESLVPAIGAEDLAATGGAADGNPAQEEAAGSSPAPAEAETTTVNEVQSAPQTPTPAALTSISGVVSGASPEGLVPLADVSVNAFLQGGSSIPLPVQTDDTGKYVLADLQPGVYYVSWHAEFGSSYLSEYATVDASSSVVVNKTLQLGTSIKGTILKNLDGQISPAVGVEVSALPSTGNGGRSAVTDSSGRYAINSLGPGDYKLWFTAGRGEGSDNVVSEYYDHAADYLSAKVVTVAYGQAGTGIDTTLQVGASVAGTVTKNVGGTVSPMSNAFVSVYDASSTSTVGFAQTDGNGRFIVSGLPAGDYIVGVRASGWDQDIAPGYYPSASTMASATVVTVGARAAVTGINTMLSVGATISGSLMQEVGGLKTPLVSGSISVMSASDGSYAGSAFAQADGRYTVKALPPGDYKVAFNSYDTASGLLAEYYDDAQLLADAKVVTVAAGAAVSGTDATLSKGSAIGGTVTANSGGVVTPAADVSVVLYSGQQSAGSYDGNYYGRTDANGVYKVVGLPSGSYKVSFNELQSGGSNDPRLKPEFHKDAATLESATPVIVGSVETVTVNAELEDTTPLPPMAAGTVAIAGDVRAGSTLTAQVSGWPAGVTLAYQWLRGGTPIFGATKSGYAVAGTDIGTKLSVSVTGTLAGYAPGFVTSPATVPVLPPPAVQAGDVTLSGTAKVGSTLTANAGTWAPADTVLEYQWLRSGSPIASATGTSYTVSTADQGSTLSVRVTGSRSGYTSSSATSATTAIVPVPGAVTATIDVVPGTNNSVVVKVNNATDDAAQITVHVADEPWSFTLAAGKSEQKSVSDLTPGSTVSVMLGDKVLASYTVPEPVNTTPASTIGQGGSLEVSGAGYKPFEVVEIWLHSTPVLLGTLTADAQGRISGRFAIPANTPAGTHHIVMVDSAGVERVSDAITVALPAAVKPAAGKPAAGSPAALAHTGVDVTAGWIALAMLVLGGLAFVGSARARRTKAMSNK